jgi:HSP20 family protein
MTLIRFKNPESPATTSGYNNFSDLMENMFGQADTPVNRYEVMTNILENDNAYIIELAVPGYDKKDIALNVENDELFIKGSIEENKETTNYMREEFTVGNFEKKFVLPETVDTGKINAKYDNGVLNVTLPKKEESKPRSINVKIS